MTETATRKVGNSSTGPIFLEGYGVLLPDDERETPEPVEVPETDQVRELLGYGALWTHEQEQTTTTTEADASAKED